MRAFIIRPFGVKQGIDFDRVEKELIDPALSGLGVTGRTTAEILRQGNIHYAMFQRLLTAELVIADLSIHNANVFYELGIRHALRKKRTFLLRTRQDDYPFDLQTYRYLTYDKDEPAASLPALTEALRQTLASDDQDSPVFQWLPELQEPSPSSFLAVPRGFHEDVDRAKAGGEKGDLGMLAAETEGFEWESKGLRVVGRAQFALKAYQGARATWEAIRRIDPLDLEANFLLGTIYQRLDDLIRSDQAVRRALEFRYLIPSQRAEAHALLARNAKTHWKSDWSQAPAGMEEPALRQRREKALRSPFLEESFAAYSRGFEVDLNGFYPGLNALAMLTIQTELAGLLPEVWGERFERERDAESVLEERRERRQKIAAAVEIAVEAARTRLAREETKDPWVEISAADLLCLTSKRPPRVADAYRKALADVSIFNLGAVRDQLQIYRDLGILTANVQAAATVTGLELDGIPEAKSEPPRVLLFTGHMIDTPKREKPRFPSDKEGVARQVIQEAIEAERKRPGGVGLGIAGGASGGDILFHEICANLGIPTRLFLALPANQFIRESVAPAEGNWVKRFERLSETLPVRVLAESKELPSWLAEKKDYSIWQRNNLWMLHNALALGGEHVTLIALWNGQEGDGPGGTGDLVSRAKERGAKVLILDTTKLFS
ncbi:MAG TPA: tetratricopeptide repeat-containing protein [Thermoanaerobaculia bacterium]|nr:tetratricopeptide repeat-containing protein [Thermoanaerobaculia bacterium]